ncbi:RUN domain-containing protein 1 [Trichinella spiralis]|uniref:RUN domain-containing protein 1 n=1 Tax=Trichinella spiralis TaxID=6334 RepID=A0A0V1C2Q0_TRISP|nr:RUN domain-containing protein 1 [Trichinella spiralis]
MSNVGDDLDCSEHISIVQEEPIPSERLVPLGASSSEVSSPCTVLSDIADDHYVSERFRQLEDEQEQLTSSLLALSCHFAQVQFRLQQICKAPTEEKDRLLRELEEFSFRECPDILEAKRLLDPKRVSDNLHSTHSDKLNIDRQQLKEVQLIEQLKQQLNDLEAFAYERGEGDLPSSKIIEKQRAVIDHLQQLMPLNLNQFERLSSEELQSEVNQALKKLVNPIKVKEQLVQQLQTQIVDLERFVEFLQGSSAAQPNDTIRNALAKKKPNPVGKDSGIFATLLSQISTVLQVYILSQLGCQSRRFRRNALKNSFKGSHWGDLRAALEISINEMVEICEQYDLSSDAGANRRSLTMSQSEVTMEEICPREILRAVRRNLCPALRDLLQHGLVDFPAHQGSVFGCFSKYNEYETNVLHVWNVVEKFYELKHGKELADAPVRKLSTAFQLENIGGKSITSRQRLLTTIDNILSTHVKLKRSSDAMFKAFISAALNYGKLSPWLRMIFHCKEILDDCYTSWSYCTVALMKYASHLIGSVLSNFAFRLILLSVLLTFLMTLFSLKKHDASKDRWNEVWMGDAICCYVVCGNLNYKQIDGMTVQNIDLFAEKINHYESALTLISLVLRTVFSLNCLIICFSTVGKLQYLVELANDNGFTGRTDLAVMLVYRIQEKLINHDVVDYLETCSFDHFCKFDTVTIRKQMKKLACHRRCSLIDDLIVQPAAII